MSYTDITSDDVEVFKAVLKNNMVSVVKAGATWCGPCKRIAPEVEKIYPQLSDNVHVYHILCKPMRLSNFVCIVVKMSVYLFCIVQKFVCHLPDPMPFLFMTSNLINTK